MFFEYEYKKFKFKGAYSFLKSPYNSSEISGNEFFLKFEYQFTDHLRLGFVINHVDIHGDRESKEFNNGDLLLTRFFIEFTL